MYLFLVFMLVGLIIGLVKYKPQFINGYSNNEVTSLAKFIVFRPLVHWHESQLLEYSNMSLNKVTHQ